MHFSAYLRLVALFIAILLVNGESIGQIRPGIKFGVSTPDVSPKDFIVTDEQGVAHYQIFAKARYGVHAGAFIQLQLGNFFIQPEILYNSTSVDYTIDDLNLDSIREFRDTYRNVDFPVMLGLKAGALRIGAGPVGHIYFQERGGFDDYDSFDSLIDDFAWGWQAGIGLDFWKLHIDARYEGNFNKLGDHISFFGKRFDFATNNNRIIASLGFSF